MTADRPATEPEWPVCPRCWHGHLDYDDEDCVSCGCEAWERVAAEKYRAEAAQGAAPLEVEAWIAGYVAGREDGPGQPDDEVAERAVDAVCAIRMDAIASEGAAPRGEGHDPDCASLSRHGPPFDALCDCRAAPRAEGLDVERLAELLTEALVRDGCLDGMHHAVHVKAHLARLSRPSDERVPESEEPR